MTKTIPEAVRSKIQALAVKSPSQARRFLREKLGLKKTQSNALFRRIVSGERSPAPVIPATSTLAPRKVRRLFWDIETSPNVVLTWRIGYKINLDHSNLLKERAIICIGYKWEGDDKTHAVRWDKDQCDKAMLAEFLKVANEADELVAHNGDRFDMAWFKTRCLFHGLQAMPDYKTVDTLQWARRRFYFNSNKLDYIAKFLGLGGKLKTEFGLWKQIVLSKDEDAMRRMLDYCKKDVVLLEQVWKRLSQSVAPKTHAGVLGGGTKWQCPRDGSENVKLNKVNVTAGGVRQYQMRCLDCGGYYSLGQPAYNAYEAFRKARGRQGWRL